MTGLGQRIASLLPDRIRESFLAKFWVGVLVVALVVGAAGYGVLLWTEATLQSDVNEKLQTQALAEADSVGEFTARYRELTRMTAADPVASSSGNVSNSFLDDERNRSGDPVVALHIVRAFEKDIVVSTRSDLSAGDNVSYYPWLETLSFSGLDDVYVSDPYRNSRGEDVIAFVSPVNQAPATVLVVTVNTTAVGQKFGQSIDGSFTRIVDSTGTVLFSDDPNRTLKPYLRTTDRKAAVVRKGETGESGISLDSIKEDERAGEYVVAYAPIDGADWVLVKHAPTENAYQVSRNVGFGVLVLLAVAVTGVLVIGATLGRRTSRSIRRLAQKARAVEDGDYDVGLTSDRHDEVGDLYEAIEGMRDALVARIEAAKQARKQLRETNEQLEDQQVVVSLLNRVVRHNVRNETQVILANAERIETSDDRFETETDRISKHALALVDRAEAANRIERIVTRDTAQTRVELTELLSDEVEHLQDVCPSADIRLTLPEEPCVVTAHDEIAVAFEHLLTNAVEHNDTPDPTVEVVVTADENTLTVTVSDDGPGIPPGEAEVFDHDPYKGPQHQSGLGLWVTHWLVSVSGGDVTVEVTDGEGSEIKISFERSDQSC